MLLLKENRNSSMLWMFFLLFYSFFLDIQLRGFLDGYLSGVFYLLLAVVAAAYFFGKKGYLDYPFYFWLVVILYFAWCVITILYGGRDSGYEKLFRQIILFAFIAGVLKSISCNAVMRVISIFFYFAIALDLAVIVLFPSLGVMGGVSGLHYHKNQLGGAFGVISVFLAFSSYPNVYINRTVSLLLAIFVILIGAKTAFFAIFSSVSVGVLYPFFANRFGRSLVADFLFVTISVLSLAVLFFGGELLGYIYNNLSEWFMTGRGSIWLLGMYLNDDIYFGSGFGGFWGGEAGGLVSGFVNDPSTEWMLKIEQGHNGYLDQVLMVGIIGLSFYLFMTAVFTRLALRNVSVFERGTVACFSYFYFHNFGETSIFNSFSPIWVVYLILLFNSSRKKYAPG